MKKWKIFGFALAAIGFLISLVQSKVEDEILRETVREMVDERLNNDPKE